MCLVVFLCTDNTVNVYIIPAVVCLFVCVCLYVCVCFSLSVYVCECSDNRGRVVIITGIPYAPYFEPWVVLKKRFLDDQRLASQAVTMTAPAVPAPVAVTAGPMVSTSASAYMDGIRAASNNAGVNGNNVYNNPYNSMLTTFQQQHQQQRQQWSMKGVKSCSATKRLTGQQWYEQSAIRAVNQAIGE